MKRLWLLALVACTPSITFECTEDGPCGEGGVCAAPGFCAFEDADCPSGRRFGPLASEALADECTAAPPSEMTLFPAADAWIDSEVPGQNHGRQNLLRMDHDPVRVGLLRFDLGAIPAGSTIVAAELEVTTVAVDGAFDMGGVIRLYPLREAWDEGSVENAAGTSSWMERQAGVAWSGAGATGASRVAEATGAITPVADDTAYTLELPAALVQGWLDDGATNFGWVLVAEEAMNDSALLVSREGAEGKRPRLVVSYR
jgi:hypothetical protein